MCVYRKPTQGARKIPKLTDVFHAAVENYRREIAADPTRRPPTISFPVAALEYRSLLV
jgi:methyl coenzyme M reductase subunit C-like uncharacterized protein (methanogenesis marker protein 7)